MLVDAGEDQEVIGNLIVIFITLGVSLGSLVQIPLSKLVPDDY